MLSPEDRGEVEIPGIVSEEERPFLERLKELLYVDPRVEHLATINIVQGGYGEVLAYPCGVSVTQINNAIKTYAIPSWYICRPGRP